VNEWFISLPAIGVAKTLLEVHPKLGEFVRGYSARMRQRQMLAIAQVEEKTGLPLIASPVWLNALLDKEKLSLEIAKQKYPGLEYFVRGSGMMSDRQEARFCLTPVFLWQDLNK